MSNELIKYESKDLDVLGDIENTNKIFQALCRLPHYQKMGQDNLYALICKARSLGMDPVYAANGGLYVLKGKVGLTAEAMAAMIREKGHSITKAKESTDSVCILHGKRKDTGDYWMVKFSIDDAKRAGIYSNTWEKYPGAMIYARALSMLARQLFPDVIKGAGYVPEEIQEIVKSQQQQEMTETIPTEIVPQRISAQQVDELSLILGQCDPKYYDQVWSTLRKPPIAIDTLDDLSPQLYDRIRSAAQKNAIEYKAHQLAAQTAALPKAESPRSMDEVEEQI